MSMHDNIASDHPSGQPSDSVDNGSRRLRMAEIRRQQKLMKTVEHIAKHALKGESGFDANYSIFRYKQPRTPDDWLFVEESLAGHQIKVSFIDREDNEHSKLLDDDYSHRIVDVKSLPSVDSYEPKHSR